MWGNEDRQETVEDFVAGKASKKGAVQPSKNHKAQQRSTSEAQRVQYPSLKNNKFQQSSTRI